MQDCKVNILGADYSITFKKYKDDEYFAKNDCNGYCSGADKKIVVCDMATWPDWENDTEEVISIWNKRTTRHEIIHAFFEESGLSTNSAGIENAWARNEEMVDWFAIQSPKIFKVFQELNLL